MGDLKIKGVTDRRLIKEFTYQLLGVLPALGMGGRWRSRAAGVLLTALDGEIAESIATLDQDRPAMRKILIGLIQLYRWFVSPLLGPN